MDTIKNPARRRLFRGTIKQTPELRLPWVIDEQTFINQCDQCQDCLPVCESQIIVRDEAGFPKIDFSQGDKECTFCHKCSEACDKPLFSDNKLNPPWPAHINISDKCLASNNIYCQSCRDVCEPKAITFTLTDSPIPTPQLNIADCTSCGACLSTCPQDAISFMDQREIKNA